ncbi:MAG: hypothetical protein MI742_05680 [Desulfobacterales bacterium]|nr:hypothetical protein [Desulfobacterales bacterium]
MMILRCLLLILLFPCLTPFSSWAALTPMDENELGAIHASQGVLIDFNNLSINKTTHTLRFTPHNSVDTLGHSITSSLSLYSSSAQTLFQGSLGLRAKKYTAQTEDFWVNDVWKKTSGNYVFKKRQVVHVDSHHTLSGRTPLINNRSRSAVLIDLISQGTKAFLKTSGTATLAYTTGSGSTAQDLLLGKLHLSNLQLHQGDAMIYALQNIPNYATGQGVAMQLRLKTSIEELSYSSNQNQKLLSLKGIHLKESFDRNDCNAYDFLGNPIKNDGNLNGTTGDTNGYQSGEAVKLIPSNITNQWGNYHPGTARNINNMYGGYFMVGNLRQVEFYDHIAGNRDIAVHRPWYESSNGPGYNNGQHRLNDDGTDVQSGEVQSVKITERPVTFSVKKRANGSAYIDINLTLHGSLRVEQVMGYNASGNNSYLGGNSLGPIILDGIRVKYCHIEFPGPQEIYTLTTVYNDSGSQHDYKYLAGHLPVAQNKIPGGSIPSGQAAYNPMGRGQEWFLNTQGNSSLSSNSNWDIYRVKQNGMDYWRIEEPNPPSGYFN